MVYKPLAGVPGVARDEPSAGEKYMYLCKIYTN